MHISVISLLSLNNLQVTGGFVEIGVGSSPNDVEMSWMRLQTPVECVPHLYQCIQSVLAP